MLRAETLIPSGSQQRGITDRHSPSCLQASGSLSLDRRLDVAGSRGFHCARRTVAASISAAGYAGLNLSQRPSISGRRKRLRPGECLSPRLLRSMATLEGACWPGTTPRHLPQILRWPGGAALTGERHTVVSHSFIESGQHLACPSLRGAPCCHVHASVSPLERLRQKARARLFASRPRPVRPLPPAIRGRRGLARSLPTSTTFQSRRKIPRKGSSWRVGIRSQSDLRRSMPMRALPEDSLIGVGVPLVLFYRSCLRAHALVLSATDGWNPKPDGPHFPPPRHVHSESRTR